MSRGDYGYEAGNENTADASVLLPWCLGGLVAGKGATRCYERCCFQNALTLTIFDIETELIDEQSYEF